MNAHSQKPRAVIYQQLGNDGSAPKGQLSELKAYANELGVDVVKVITDTHDPDKKSPNERRGLIELLNFSSKKQFEVLVAWSLDDLSRLGVRCLLNHLRTLRNNSVDWFFLKDPLFNSMGKQSDVVLSVLARLTESANFRKNLRTDRERRASKKVGKRGLAEVGKPRKQTLAKIERAKALRALGWTFELIGADLGVSRERAYQLCEYQIKPS